jgi:quercetin dioxygenase-like cupin family protein
MEVKWIDIGSKTEKEALEHYNRNDLNIEILYAGHALEIPRGRVHQMTAQEDSEVFEFSTPSKDSDSYRLTQSK